MKKQLLSLLLTLSMVLCLLPATAFAEPVTYDIWVGDTQITSENAGDVLGDGTVSYDRQTATLTLNNANINGAYPSNFGPSGIYANEAQGLNIKLIGGNTVDNPNTDGGHSYGIRNGYGSLTISGEGSLAVTSVSSAVQTSSTGISSVGPLVITSGTVTATGGQASSNGWSYGLEASSIIISGGTVKATGNQANISAGLYAGDNGLVISGGNVTAKGSELATKSYGILAELGSGATLSGGTVKATGNTSAFLKEPTLNANGTYKWKTSETASYTESTITEYKHSASQTFVDLVLPVLYTVSFDNNGAAGGTLPGALTQASEGSTVSVPAPSEALCGTKAGYTLDTTRWATAADGTTYVNAGSYTPSQDMTLYAVWIPQSSNANLSALTITPGILTPVFAEDTINYTAAVPAGTSSISVTPTVADTNAAVTINGKNAVSGSPVSVGVGTNTVSVVVTAEDKSTKTYTLTVNISPQAAPTVTGNAETISQKGDGTMTGLTTDMEYATTQNGDYRKITDAAMTFAAGTYYVRYGAVPGSPASSATRVEIVPGRKLRVTLPETQTGYILTANKTQLDWKESVTFTYALLPGYAEIPGSFQVLLNGEKVTLAGGSFTKANVQQDVTVTVDGVQSSAALSISATGSTNFTANKAQGPAVFTIGAGVAGFNATNNFAYAALNNTRLDLGAVNGAPGADGSIKDGSIIITIFKERLNKLGAGNHKLVVTLKDGKTVTDTVTVIAAANGGGTGNTGGAGNTGGTGNTGSSGNTGNTGNTGNNGSTGNTGNTGNTISTGNTGNAGSVPQTGDSSSFAVWFMLLFISGGVALTAVGMNKKRKRKNRK